MMQRIEIEPPSPAFFQVDAIFRCAERHGWPGPQAFRLAMMLHIQGITPAEAEQLFKRAEERVQ